MITRRATAADLPAVHALLDAAGLTRAGADEAFEHGVVIEAAGEIVAAAAVEPRGASGLLRSVVVAPGHRGQGLGGHVVATAEGLAASVGVRELYLLTETAEAWFPRHGYQPLERDQVPPEVRRSVEFTGACSASAIAMRRHLRGGASGGASTGGIIGAA